MVPPHRRARLEVGVEFERVGLAPAGSNHPLAERMGVIAGFSHNIVAGTIFGTFTVLLPSARDRLGVSLQAASLGIPLVVIVSSLLAVVVGVLAARYSLRLLLTAGAASALAAFLLLAFTRSYPVYLFAYGALLGPAMAVAGYVGPATLVTRWFTRNRGLVLGLVHLPVVVAVLPVIANWVLHKHGVQATYLLAAGLVGIVLLPMTLLASDGPPGSRSGAPATQAEPQPALLTVRQLLGLPLFWAMTVGGSVIAAGTVLLGAVLVPMAISWGVGGAQTALLLTILSLAGIAGSVILGWLADLLGGARSLVLLCFDLAILWAVLLFQPGFGVLAVVVGLIGLHGAGMIPSLGRALADALGPANFSRAFGLATTLSLPLTFAALIGSSRIFGATGSFASAVAGMTALYTIAAPITLFAARRCAVPERASI